MCPDMDTATIIINIVLYVVVIGFIGMCCRMCCKGKDAPVGEMNQTVVIHTGNAALQSTQAVPGQQPMMPMAQQQPMMPQQQPMMPQQQSMMPQQQPMMTQQPLTQQQMTHSEFVQAIVDHHMSGVNYIPPNPEWSKPHSEREFSPSERTAEESARAAQGLDWRERGYSSSTTSSLMKELLAEQYEHYIFSIFLNYFFQRTRPRNY